MNSKIFNILILSFITLVTSSCQNIENQELELTVIPYQVFAIPAPAKTIACDGETEISGAYLDFPKFKFNWKGKGDFQLMIISVKINSSFINGGTYSSMIAGDDLVSTLAGTPSFVAEGAGEQTTGCGVRVGGINFNDGVTTAFLSGYIRALGVQINDKGEQTPVSAEIPISVMYEKF